MKKLILLFLSLLYLAFGCTKDGNHSSTYTPKRFTQEHFRVPLPAGIYVPQGLKALNILETQIAKDKDNFKFDNITIKSFDGTVIGADSVMRSMKPYWIQLYANDSGRVVEGVAFYITKDFQRDILEWK